MQPEILDEKSRGEREPMKQERSNVVKEDLDAQRQHWENTVSTRREMFGVEASPPARYAAEVFKNERGSCALFRTLADNKRDNMRRE
jgi:hypothetical protein